MNITPIFGQAMTNSLASLDNPTRSGMYVRTIRRRGRMNPGYWYELTDGDGRFWLAPAGTTTVDEYQPGLPSAGT